MFLRRETVRIKAIKRKTGEVIEGTCTNDGLQSMWYVGDKIVSVLDHIVEWEVLDQADRPWAEVR